jgi:hypothetical protein
LGGLEESNEQMLQDSVMHDRQQGAGPLPTCQQRLFEVRLCSTWNQDRHAEATKDSKEIALDSIIANKNSYSELFSSRID